jgi:acetyl esterase
MALDEATGALLAQMAESGMPPLHEMTPVQARGLGASLLEMYGPGPEVGEVTDESVPVDGGAITVRVLTPRTEPRAVIVYYHGGGWVIGALDEFETLARQLVDRTGATVLLVDYRLAPEYRYPTAAEDAWAALQWAEAYRQERGPAGTSARSWRSARRPRADPGWRRRSWSTRSPTRTSTTAATPTRPTSSCSAGTR